MAIFGRGPPNRGRRNRMLVGMEKCYQSLYAGNDTRLRHVERQFHLSNGSIFNDLE